jgi:hypothetical protein
MTTASYNEKTNTLAITPPAVPWSETMEKLYRGLCAPSNTQFLLDAMAALPLLSPQERSTVIWRVATTTGLDRTANRDYVMHLFDEVEKLTKQ